MTIYHTSPRTGGTARCRAIGACPYGATFGTSILRNGTTAFGTASPTWRDMKDPPQRSEERIIVNADGEVVNVWNVENRKLRTATNTSSPTVEKPSATEESESEQLRKRYIGLKKQGPKADITERKAAEEAWKKQYAENVKTGNFTAGKDQPTEKDANIDNYVANYSDWDRLIDNEYAGGTEKFYNLEKNQVKRVANSIAKKKTDNERRSIELINDRQRKTNEEENNHPEYNIVKQPESIFTGDHLVSAWENHNTANTKTGSFTVGKDQPTEKKVNIDDMIANYQHWDATVDRNYRGGIEKFNSLEKKQVKRAATRIAKLETERQQKAIEHNNERQRETNEQENNHPEYNIMKQPETIFTAEHFVTLWEKNNPQN